MDGHGGFGSSSSNSSASPYGQQHHPSSSFGTYDGSTSTATSSSAAHDGQHGMHDDIKAGRVASVQHKRQQQPSLSLGAMDIAMSSSFGFNSVMRSDPPQMTTPDSQAQWGSSSAAPLVTLTNDATVEQELLDPNNRPYTPSYNSTGDFSDIISEQQDFLTTAVGQIDGVDFVFDGNDGESGGITSSFDYDPDTADSYNHLNATLLAQSILGDNPESSSLSNNATAGPSAGSGRAQKTLPTFAFSQDPGGYRDPNVEAPISPIASPLLGPLSSPQHTRQSSFGSSAGFSPNPAGNGEGDAAFQQIQSLGQRMTLHDPIVHRQVGGNEFNRSNDSSPLRSAHHQGPPPGSLQAPPYFEPVFEEESGAAEGQGNDGNKSADTVGSSTPFPSYTYSAPMQGGGNTSESDGGSVPMLTINENYPFGSSGPQQQQQDTQSFQFPSRSQQPWMMGLGGAAQPNSPFAASDAQAASSYASLAQHQGGKPEAYTPGATLSQRPLDGQQQEEPKRQDSYDRVKKFLRLDVDMGFQAERDPGSGEGLPRKRSNSDVGPFYKEGEERAQAGGGQTLPSPSPFTVVTGGVSDKTPVAMSSGVDWATEMAKQRRMQQLAALGLQSSNNATAAAAAAMGLDPHNAFMHATMDPNLLQHQHNIYQQQQQQQQQQHYMMQPQQQQEPASGPVRQRENSASGRGTGPYGVHGRAASSGSLAAYSPSTGPGSPPPQQQQQQQQQQAQQQQQQMSGLHRSNSSRSTGRSRHSRLAQSEDLSQMARMSNPSEFLNRITAPDGSLAPPGVTSMGPPGMRNSIPRINTDLGMGMGGYPTAPGSFEYGGRPPSSEEMQQQHHFQQSMNRYGSLRNSPGPHQQQQPMIPTIYSQTQSPTYGALYTPDRMSGGRPSAYEMDGMSTGSGPYPVVQQVTTSATQAASASRRKNDAVHVCPIPGCGSTFTRKFNLNGHIRSHTGQRPYQCRAPGCGKSFARSFDLSRHEKLHAGIKPHTCETCGKAFARADALSRHLRNDAGQGGCATRSSDGESTIDGSSSRHGEDDARRHASDGEEAMQMRLAMAKDRFKGHVL